ncbi:MAG: TetR/AcrR family transcriptional regulator [Sandaracinaceae bacterium]|nr:TetR/AcrR family transcriptional regulator [Sandaracinaceae bacterium]
MDPILESPERSNDSVARILDAAARSFRTRGYAETSVRAISEEAGVSKSLVLYHFGSKEQLYVEVQRRFYARLASEIRALADARGGSAADRGLVGLDALLAAVRESDDFAAHALLGARALTSPRIRAVVTQLRSEMHQLICRTMVELLGPDLPLGLDPETAADVLLSTISGLGLLSVSCESSERVERAFAAWRSLFALALAAGSRS